MKSYQRASQCIALVAMSAAAAIAALAAQNNDQKRHPTQRGAPAQTYHAARPQYPSNRNAPAYHYPSGSQAPKAPPTNDYGRRTLQSGPQHIQSAGPRQSYGAQHFQSGGPRQSYGAQHFQTGGFQRSHSSALTSRQFSLRNNVRVAAEPRSRSMTYTKPVAGGSLSMRTRYVRGRPVVTSAFIMRRANGVTTRTYLDGSRFEETSEYSRFRSPAGYTLTTYSTGLRRAEAPNGRLMYSEAYRATQINGVQNRVIERTVYRETILGRTVIYPTPIIRTYYPGFVNGVPYYVYRPVFYAPAYYRPFYFHVRRPFFVGIGCIFCPPPVVAWVNPPASYVDPLVLLGDLMIATAVADAQPPEDPNLLPPPDPEVAQLKAQVAQQATPSYTARFKRCNRPVRIRAPPSRAASRTATTPKAARPGRPIRVLQRCSAARRHRCRRSSTGCRRMSDSRSTSRSRTT